MMGLALGELSIEHCGHEAIRRLSRWLWGEAYSSEVVILVWRQANPLLHSFAAVIPDYTISVFLN